MDETANGTLFVRNDSNYPQFRDETMKIVQKYNGRDRTCAKRKLDVRQCESTGFSKKKKKTIRKKAHIQPFVRSTIRGLLAFTRTTTISRYDILRPPFSKSTTRGRNVEHMFVSDAKISRVVLKCALLRSDASESYVKMIEFDTRTLVISQRVENPMNVRKRGSIYKRRYVNVVIRTVNRERNDKSR